jgi:hypothetical protein
MPKAGIHVPKLFKSRIVRKIKAKRATNFSATNSATSGNRGVVHQNTDEGNNQAMHPNLGRPRLAARALDVQYLLN